jgi:hypothetical protein
MLYRGVWTVGLSLSSSSLESAASADGMFRFDVVRNAAAGINKLDAKKDLREEMSLSLSLLLSFMNSSVDVDVGVDVDVTNGVAVEEELQVEVKAVTKAD